jgi:PIN domain nuclease of toxin-antitoxin system
MYTYETRDPFDRLLVAHARLRGWRLATADNQLVKRLGPSERVEL